MTGRMSRLEVKGGTNHPRNIKPKPHSDHMQEHKQKGDLSRMQRIRQFFNRQQIKWKPFYRRR